MGLVEISGPIRDGMWYYGEPYLDMPVTPPRIREVDFPEKYRGSLFTQMLDMCVQTGTYLETASHVYKDREDIDEVPLERTWMIPTVVLHTPKGPREKVTLEEAQRSLREQGVTVERGDALLIHTGWDRAWNDAARFLGHCPYLSRELMYWMMDQRVGIFGCDTPRAESTHDPQGFFPDFFRTEILLLAPVVNLAAVTRADPKPRLCVLPLAIDGACASPVRAVLVTD